MGADARHSAGYRLLYRSFNHGRMKDVCKSLDVPFLKETLRQQFGRSAVSQGMREFANDFVTLQDARHRADYDLFAAFGLSESTAFIDLAENAMTGFDRVSPDEKADVLALMLSNVRG